MTSKAMRKATQEERQTALAAWLTDNVALRAVLPMTATVPPTVGSDSAASVDLVPMLRRLLTAVHGRQTAVSDDRQAWEAYGARSRRIRQAIARADSPAPYVIGLANPMRRARMGDALRHAVVIRRQVARRVPTDDVSQAWPYSPDADAYPVAPTLTAWEADGMPAWAIVTGDDCESLRRDAAHYCRTVDARRTRKRADDVAGDVAGDAALTYARLLREAQAWPVVTYGAPDCPDDRESWVTADLATATVRARFVPVAWVYVSKREETLTDLLADDDDGADDDSAPTGRTVTRATLRRWAIHDGARRNGYADLPADDDGTDSADAWREAQEAQEAKRVKRMGGLPSGTAYVGVATLRTARATADPARAQAVRTALRDAPPEVRTYVMHALAADGARSGRTGALTDSAQAIYGGTRGSRRIVARFRDALEPQARAILDHVDAVAPVATLPTVSEAVASGLSLVPRKRA